MLTVRIRPKLATRAHSFAALMSATFMSLLISGVARAQFAVIDVASLGQLVQQAEMLAQQLAAARSQLLAAQSQYQAMVGNRGMQSLLAGTIRNYLPAQWSELTDLLQGSDIGRGVLASDFQHLLQANAVLSPLQLAALSSESVRKLQVRASRSHCCRRWRKARSAMPAAALPPYSS